SIRCSRPIDIPRRRAPMSSPELLPPSLSVSSGPVPARSVQPERLPEDLALGAHEVEQDLLVLSNPVFDPNPEDPERDFQLRVAPSYFQPGRTPIFQRLDVVPLAIDPAKAADQAVAEMGQRLRVGIDSQQLTQMLAKVLSCTPAQDEPDDAFDVMHSISRRLF